MATINSKTIGPTGDYATLALWFADCPADLTAPDSTGYIYRGKVQSAGLVCGVNALSISGKTGVDATHYVELTADDGASFVDHANVRTNALRYNESNGAFIRTAGASGVVITNYLAYTRINKLQFSSTDTSATPASLLNSNSANCVVDSCIFESFNVSSSYGVAYIGGAGARISNSVLLNKRASGGQVLLLLSYAASAYNCTLAALGGVVGTGIAAAYGTAIVKNCYVGNVTTLSSGTLSVTSSGTSVSTTPAGWSNVPLSSDTFESVANGTHDMRLKTGSALIDAGSTESTYAANDITGFARSGSWDVGAYEISAGTGAVTHETTGALTAGAATIAGTATHLRTHSASGSLAAQSAIVAGSAARSGSSTTHSASGSLTAGAAVVNGSASHAASGSFISDVLGNNTSSIWASTAVVWEWREGTGIGVAPTSVTYGTGTTSALGVLTCTGLPAGTGELLIATPDYVSVAYQRGTVA